MGVCHFKFKDKDGTEITVIGKPAMQAYLADGGLEHLFPGKVFPWMTANDNEVTEKSNNGELGFDLADAFAKRLLDGESFKSILLSRKALTNTVIKSGSIEAKRADELIELAGVIAAREIVEKGLSESETFEELASLAERMPSLNVRTSTSIMDQAYSTPLPIAYIASVRAGITKNTTVTEPTAGNGALLIVASPDKVVANELNKDRFDALKHQGFEVYNKDAVTFNFGSDSDVVIANPPFGVVKDDNGTATTFKINNQYSTNEIDHAIALNALKSMKKDGRAVLIVGAPAKILSDDARSNAYNGKAKRSFYHTLYNQYNVTDHFTVSGDLYAKQGASWPVDVIVIEGTGKSSLRLPAADLPRIINSITELKNELQSNRESLQESESSIEQGIKTESIADDEGSRASADRKLRDGSNKDDITDGVLPRPGRKPKTDRQGQPTNADGQLNSSSTRAARVDTANDKIENKFQADYTPASKVNSVGTLVPINMQSSVSEALNRLENKYDSIDGFVADQLGYDKKDIGKYFSAEQVDAIALALDNINDGKGFIIGDQTGVGKGRVNAAMIKYAIKNKIVPIWVTEKPNLYGDMIRDLNDIGMTDIKPFATNSAFDIPIDNDAQEWYSAAEKAKENGETVPKKYGKFIKTSGNSIHSKLMSDMIQSGRLTDYDAIFTTYSQMQTIKGARTIRMDFLSALSNGGLLILDESHNAGGTTLSERKGGKDVAEVEEGTKGGRAGFTRLLVSNAKGVFYSSATYAKRPDVLDLYSKTDMGLIADPNALKEALQAGGVPLQQAVASMLAKSGQYIRREKSFDGIAYDTVVAEVDKQFAEKASEVMRDIMRFDEVKALSIKALDDELKSEARKISGDKSTGGAGASSTNFTSVMHNMIGQMLLMLKVQPAIDEALSALKRDEKPVITLSNTMGSAIDEYVKDAGLNPGDAISLNFGDLLKRYLSKSRRVIEGDPFGKKTSRYLTDEELGPSAVKFYKSVEKKIDDYNFASYPVSPIDAIHNALHKEGYKTGEITGRGSIIDYSGNMPIYKRRPSQQTTAAGKRKTINDFNNGLIDVVILNQSGATGLSLHSSPKVGNDTRKRYMIIAQPELNIDTHCLDSETEVLTPDGFKKYNVEFDTVAAFNQDTGEVTWQPVTGKVKRTLCENEEMYGIESPGLSIRVTGNHRMVFKNKNDKSKKNWSIIDASELSSKNQAYYIPLAGVQIPDVVVNLTDDELRFIGWYLTDGTLSKKSHQVIIWQAEHQPHHDDIKKCLDGCGFPYGTTIRSEKTQFNSTSSRVGYCISKGRKGEYWGRLEQYLKKDFSPLLDDLSRDQLLVLLEAIHLGDGTKYNNQSWTRRSYHIATGNINFASRLQSLCVRRGLKCNLAEAFYNKNPLYMLHIKDSSTRLVGGTSSKDRPRFEKVDSIKNEIVWCVENPYGTLIVRRKGKVSVIGNCQMLGRVNRTGQLITPSYGQLVANVPAEKRPSAILAKKMAMLNAQTTAGKESAVKAKDVPDFMNEYGDEVAASVMNDNRDIHRMLGKPLAESESTGFEKDGAMRKVTGRIPVLSLKDQEMVYSLIEDAYNEYIDILTKTGQNQLEAEAMKLDAKTVSSTQVSPPLSDSNSPFAEGVNAEIVDVKKLGKPYTVDQIKELIAKVGITDANSQKDWVNNLTDNIAKEYDNRMAIIEAMPEDDDAEIKRKRGSKDNLNNQKDFVESIINKFPPGKPVRLFSPMGIEYIGYVGNFERKGDAKNYFAQGQWKLTTYVADAAKQFVIPISRLSITSLDRAKSADTDSSGKWIIESSSISDVNQALTDGHSESRENRVILTGNMLSAYAFDKTGQIINYTTDSGETKQGIMMPKKFDLAVAIDAKPIQFTNQSIAAEYLNTADRPDYGVRSRDNYFRILPQYNGSMVMYVPSSKTRGGMYFGNKRLIELTGDFVKSGSDMMVRFDKSKLEKILQITYPYSGSLEPISKENGKKFLERDNIKFSQSSQKLLGSTIAQVLDMLPAKARKLYATGKLVIVQSVQDLPASLFNKGAAQQEALSSATAKKIVNTQGLYNPKDDVIYLVADNLNKSTIIPAISHELLHRAFQTDSKLKLATDKFDTDLQIRFALALKGKGTKIELEAAKRVITANTPVQHQLEEFKAYIITRYALDPQSITGKLKRIIADFIAAIRIALVRAGLDFGMVRSLSPSDLFAMSGYGANVDGVSSQSSSNVLQSAKAERFYSALRRAFMTAPDKVFGNPQQIKTWINANAPKFNVKKDEIYWSGLNDWLDLQQGKVSKQDVLSFMDQNGVQIDDVLLGENNEFNEPLSASEEKELDALIDKFVRAKGVLPNNELYRMRELDKKAEDSKKLKKPIPTKHNNNGLTIPGGVNYRELVITIPTIEPYNETDSTHFGDVSNGKQVAWIRTNDRMDVDSNPTLFLEEVQSQRGQHGRTKGFMKNSREALENEYKLLSNTPPKTIEEMPLIYNRMVEIENELKTNRVPPAPFIADSGNKATEAYITLALKKAISQAVDNGQESISWTTGDQQSVRYDLSKQVERIDYNYNDRTNDYDFAVWSNTGKNLHSQSNATLSVIEEYVGKDIAKKIESGEGVARGLVTSLSGLDLKVGGGWTQSMYGNEQGLNAQGKPSLIMQAAMEIARKMGGKIGTIEILNGNIHDWTTQPALIITPEMRDKVIDEGMPLFSKKTENTGEFNPDNPDIRFSMRDSVDEINSSIREAFSPRQGKQSLGWLAGLFQRNHLIDFVAKELPMLEVYKTLSQEKDNTINKAEREIAEHYEEMKNSMTHDVMNELGRVQGLATRLKDFDPAKFDDSNPSQADISALSRDEKAVYQDYKALPDDAKKAYKMMREDYKSDLLAKKSALIQRLNAFPIDSETKAEIIKQIELHFDKAIKKGVYFPLSRNGDTVVTADKLDDDGNIIPSESIVEFTESGKATDKLMAELKERGYKNRRVDKKAVYIRSLATTNAANNIAALATKAIADLKTNIQQQGAEDILDFSGFTARDIIEGGDFNQLLSDFNQQLIDALPDTSYRKHFIHRKGTLGYSTDTLRAYAGTRTAAAKNIASLLYDHKIYSKIQDAKDAIKEMSNGEDDDTRVDSLRSVLNELELREERLKNSSITQASQILTSLGFMGALGFNVASAAVNMLQVPGVTLPELSGKHGFTKAAAEINKAYKLLFNKDVLNKHSGFDLSKHPELNKPQNAPLRAALIKLNEIGKIDLTLTHEAISMGQNPSYSDNAVTRFVGGIGRYSGYLFHIAEALNRQITGIAAFNLAYRKNGGNFDEAFKDAVDVIDRTQFDYSQSNRARYMMSDTARVLTLFKSYALGISYYIGRNVHNSLLKGNTPEIKAMRLAARKAVVTQMAMTFATSGLFGLPIGGEALAVLGGVAGFKYKGANFAVPGAVGGMLLFQALLSGLGADDEDDVEVQFRNWLTDNFDQTTAEWIVKGPARLLPMGDISSRTGLSDIWWRPQNKELEGKDQYQAFANALLGPLGSQFAGLFTATKMYQDGEYSRAIEAMSPAAIRNIIAAARMENEGVKTIKGDPIVNRDLTMTEIANKVLGFNPTVVTNNYDANTAIAKARDRIAMKKAHLVNRYISSDPQERADLMRGDIKDFNSEVEPQERITIGSLMKSIRQRKALDRRTENGLYLSKKSEHLRDIGRFGKED